MSSRTSVDAFALLAAFCLIFESTVRAAESDVSFRRDVMAVLSKAGCNSGACHGNQNGKAGFKLSLRGEDPDFDLVALTRDMFARRTNPTDPDQSLILLKATTQLAHEGGLRFRKDSGEYALLQSWIASGTPDDPPDAPKLMRLEVSPVEKTLVEPASEVPLRVRAIFSDGSKRDIRRLAVYEPASRVAAVSPEGLARRERFGEETVLVRYLDQQVPVRLTFVPKRPGFKWQAPPEHNFIDRHVWAKLRRLRMNPSGLCTDTEFLRRAYLDLLGILPTADEARAFLADPSLEKRGRLLEELLARLEFADFWALKWADILRNEEKVLDPKGIKAFHQWIRQSLAENKPLDQFVRELLASTGSTYTNPPANYYRALREPTARSEATAQLFLGTRLGCARCHNHPFDRWTQADYYDWADVFAKVQYKVVENNRRDGLDKHEFVGEQFVYEANEGEVKNPRTGKPAQARLLGTSVPMTMMVLEDESSKADSPFTPALFSSEREREKTTTRRRGKPVRPGQRFGKTNAPPERLDKLAAWLTHSSNDLFARAQVNRVWFHLMGRGLVDPIDDFRTTNPASHPALLDELAVDFIRQGFDLRWLIRLIMNSRTYQLSAEPNETNQDDEANYSHVAARRLTAEQLFDAQHQVLDVAAEFKGQPVGLRASQLPGGSPVRRAELKASSSEKLLALFGKPSRLLTCECERSNETTLNQAFQLISGPAVNRLLTRKDNRIGTLIESGQSNDEIITELYWTALSRPPTVAELPRAAQRLEAVSARRQALENLAWALLNAKEFVLRK